MGLSLDMSDLPTSQSEDQWLTLHSPWLVTKLSELKDLSNDIDGRDEAEMNATCNRTRFFIENSPKLAHLRIRRVYLSRLSKYQRNIIGRIFGRPLTELRQPLQLQTLSFEQLHLSAESMAVFQAIDLPALRTLQIIRCFPLVCLLDHLSPIFRSAGSNLKVLEIECLGARAELKRMEEAMEQLLLSFTGLQHLTTDHGTSWQHINVNAILQHHGALSSLLLPSPSNISMMCLSPPELQSIFISCPHLTQVGIHLEGLSWHYFKTIGNSSWSLHEATRASIMRLKTLRAIATAPNLHTLRILTRIPKRNFLFSKRSRANADVELTKFQVVALKFALAIMTYLRQRGSKIKLLALSPWDRYTLQGVHKDSNGHLPPHYYYKWVESQNGSGSFEGQAVPITLRTCLEDFPHTDVLVRQEV